MSSWIHELVRDREYQELAEFFANPENREIVDDVDEYERTPLIAAFDDPSPSREIIQLLLDSGAEPNVRIFMNIGRHRRMRH